MTKFRALLRFIRVALESPRATPALCLLLNGQECHIMFYSSSHRLTMDLRLQNVKTKGRNCPPDLAISLCFVSQCTSCFRSTVVLSGVAYGLKPNRS